MAPCCRFGELSFPLFHLSAHGAGPVPTADVPCTAYPTSRPVYDWQLLVSVCSTRGVAPGIFVSAGTEVSLVVDGPTDKIEAVPNLKVPALHPWEESPA